MLDMASSDWQHLDELRLRNLTLLEELHRGQEKCRALLSLKPNHSASIHPQIPDSKNVSFSSLSTSDEMLLQKSKNRLLSSKSSRDKSPVVVRSEKPSHSHARNEITKSVKYQSKTEPTLNGNHDYAHDRSSLSLNAAYHQSKKSSVYQNTSDSSRHKDKHLSSNNSSPLSKQGTPKSILKRRKIIDDNVNVSSQYDHTPNTTPKGKSHNLGLNFSYSDVDDLDPLAYTEGSHSSGLNQSASSGSSFADQPGNQKSSTAPEKSQIGSRAESLKTDSGNKRSSKPRKVTDFSQRPKTVVFDTGDEHHKASDPELVTPGNKIPAALDSRLQPPLLGYDWIAGVLDNDNALETLPEAFYDDIALFRRTNRNDCQSDPYKSNPLNLTRPLSPEIQDPQHTCIHGYEVTSRLFTEPVNADEEGRSVCPICMQPRKDPTPQSPGFVRVSIPKSVGGSPHQVKPHRRRSFEPNDSCALSEHCLAGWECIPPSTLPTASTVDMRKAVKTKQSTTVEETEKMAKAYSRSAKLMGRPAVSQPAAKPTQSRAREGDDTLNRSQAMEWELRGAPQDPHYIKRK